MTEPTTSPSPPPSPTQSDASTSDLPALKIAALEPITPEIVSPSAEALADRRHTLRRKRRRQNVQSIWRGTVVAGLAAGACWLMVQPLWLIRSPDQIMLQGNQQLTDEAITPLLPLDYPQSLLTIQPEAIATLLQAQAPIAQAIVTRHLWPPRLEIWVQERQLVAVTQPVATLNQPTGLLDAAGVWVPEDKFAAFADQWVMPTLTILGYSPRYEAQWRSLYPLLDTSPVAITQVDWRDPSNLILQTDLGPVHLGPYIPALLPQQLTRLGQLQPLQEEATVPPWSYLDLRDPTAPVLEGVTSPTPPTPTSNP